jgi:hypothetical protein
MRTEIEPQQVGAGRVEGCPVVEPRAEIIRFTEDDTYVDPVDSLGIGHGASVHGAR